MQIGDVIKKHRKDKNMTQEEMGRRLGVTASAVNKWENGNSLPDLTLLSPIARLLDLSTDALLSHEKGLSDEEANRFIEEANEKLKAESYEDAFRWMKQCLAQYPNCHYLTLWMAQIFDSQRQVQNLHNENQYDDYFLDCYRRVLESDNEGLKSAAAEALYYFFVNKKQFEQAEEYLAYFSIENPERKRKQALVYSQTGRQKEAYKLYEELLYAGYQSASMTFQALYVMALEEVDFDKAGMLVEKMAKLAALFEFGEYHEVSPGLELAALQKDEARTLQIVERMLINLESVYAFTKSPLYAHMEFKAIKDSFALQLRQDLIKGFRDEETYAYMKENQRWQELMQL